MVFGLYSRILACERKDRFGKCANAEAAEKGRLTQRCRLKFSFVNVGPVGGPSRDGNGPKVNQGKALILASCFSEVFNVYSAKKFPGVCESTPLSKTFATQGIKIPIRKDSNVKGGDGADDEYD